MKKQSIFILLLVLGLVGFTAQSCITDASAADTAEEFLTALSEGNLDKAQNMAEDGTKSLLKSIKKSHKDIKKGNQKVIILNDDQNGDAATVKFRYDDSDEVNVLHLSLDNEEWKIAIDDKNEDIMIGDQSMKELMGDLNTTLQRAIEVGAVALDNFLTGDNGLIKVASELLKMSGDAASQMADSINISSSDFEKAIQELSSKNNPELEEAKNELKKAAEKLKEIFNDKK